MGSFFLLGFLLGMRHAVEADHLIAMTTITSQDSSTKRSIFKGIYWGVGHASVLFMFAVAALFFQLEINTTTAHLLEMAVGFMLIGLGLNVLYRFKKNRVHFHAHQHGGETHLHLHAHSTNNLNNTGLTKDMGDHTHTHSHFNSTSLKSFIIGLVHGMAGSTALLLLVLQTVQSGWAGLAYVAIFGLGSIVGMTLLTTIISIPFRTLNRHSSMMQGALQITTFCCSMLFGCYIVYQQLQVLS